MKDKKTRSKYRILLNPHCNDPRVVGRLLYVAPVWPQCVLLASYTLLIFIPHRLGVINLCVIYVWSPIYPSKRLFGDKSKTMSAWAQSRQ